MTILDAVIIVLAMINFLIGYYLGRSYPTAEETLKDVKRALNTTKAGPVSRPTAKKLRTWKHTKENEEEAEMVKTLSQFPELSPNEKS